jgi:hypothetical protein
MSTHDDFIATMEAHLKKWDAEVDDMRAKGKQLAVELRAEYFGRLKQLRTLREDAQTKFQQIRCASDEAAGKLHDGMESAWVAMRNALSKASSDQPKP